MGGTAWLIVAVVAAVFALVAWILGGRAERRPFDLDRLLSLNLLYLLVKRFRGRR